MPLVFHSCICGYQHIPMIQLCVVLESLDLQFLSCILVPLVLQFHCAVIILVIVCDIYYCSQTTRVCDIYYCKIPNYYPLLGSTRQ